MMHLKFIIAAFIDVMNRPMEPASEKKAAFLLLRAP